MRGAVILDSETGKPIARPTTVSILRELSISEKDPERRRHLLRVADNLTLGAEEPYLKASKQFWRQFDQQSPLIADATQVAGTSETIIVAAQNSFLPAYYFYAGKTAVVLAWGKMTSTTSGTNALTAKLRFGVATGGTQLATSAATTLTNSKTDITWFAEAYVTCRTDGASGTVIAAGKIGCDATGNIIPAANNPITFPATAPANTTIDTTGNGGLVLTFTLSNSASNLATCQIYSIESMN